MGSFQKNELGVGDWHCRRPGCGDVMKLQIKVQRDTILDAKFKMFGCGLAIASSSLSTEWLKGKTIDEAGKIKTPISYRSSTFHPSKFIARSWPKMPSKQPGPTTKRNLLCPAKKNLAEEDDDGLHTRPHSHSATQSPDI